VGAGTVKLFPGDPAGIHVDLDDRSWQVVEIPLDSLGLTEKLGAFILSGKLQGTVYLDDLRLVVEQGAAPVSAVLVRRPVWIVEATPRDPNYLYGRILLRFDAETYQGSFASKYDRAGTLLMSYQASTGAYYTGDGGRTYIPAGGTTVRTSENFLYRRATVVVFPPRKRENPADYRVALSPDLFNMDALIRLGK
jgi:hypothetical protein